MVKIGHQLKKCWGDRGQIACRIVNDFSRNPAETNWGNRAAFLEGTSEQFGAQSSPSKDTVSSPGAQLLREAGASSGPQLLLRRCLSPATCCTLALLSWRLGQPRAAHPLREGVLCCGCFKGPRPVFDLLRSNMASNALSKTQPALNPAGTGSKEEGETAEGKIFSIGFF